MPGNLSRKLESLSGYTHLYYPDHSDAAENPVAYSHVTAHIGGRSISILSRVGAYGLDYTNRLNKLAYHVVPTSAEMTSAGPAWMLSHSDLMRIDWDGICCTTQSGPQLPDGRLDSQVCENWKSVTGDAGWGGVLAETWFAKSAKPIWITYTPEQQHLIIPLILESTALLPEKNRWQATFSTYATNIPDEFECRVQCLIAGTQAARIAAAKGKVIDISSTTQPPTTSPWTEYATSGQYNPGLPFSKTPAHPHLSASRQETHFAASMQRRRRKTFLAGAAIALTVLLLACYAGWRSMTTQSIASSEPTNSGTVASTLEGGHTKKQESSIEEENESKRISTIGDSTPTTIDSPGVKKNLLDSTESYRKQATESMQEASADPLNSPNNEGTAETNSNSGGVTTHAITTDQLLALEKNLAKAGDLESYIEKLQQYMLAVTAPETKAELEKTLSESRFWKTAMAGNAMIDTVNAESQPTEIVLDQLKQIHATLEKQSDGNPQALAIKEILQSQSATQQPVIDASFSEFGEMLYSNLITIESLAEENQGRMFIFAGSNTEIDTLKNKRDTVSMEVVKDNLGKTEETTVKTPLRIREEPKATIEWIIKNTPPKDDEFSKQWDKNILNLTAKIMQRPRLDNLIKEELIFQVLKKGANHSENLNNGLGEALEVMQSRKNQRRSWPRVVRFSSAIDEELRDCLEPALRDLYSRQSKNTQKDESVSLSTLDWMGFLWRDEKVSELTIRINCLPTKTGSLYTLVPASTKDGTLRFHQIGQILNNTVIAGPPAPPTQLGRPVFFWPYGERGDN